ncbi:TetR family transcriptional regulator (plasmid) [Rhodococcus oxybenzonivorans]|uniref:TetR family transcriptional regulator n=1 Tax=Rhodococcus oxybenzonivorans TaxID=1990687 RepID=A0A2S2C6Z7_9NOCA|nr:TetR/AcrR family transcriptional regulator [Rhodococcus oxybenzonivorans]AWK76584.1 TetR family transcriptional regulator [Rhodococcus oxybenzonivorans]
MRPSRARLTSTPRPRNRRAQILVAASALFSERGYHNVGTEDIASSVGITAGALYRHFRSKQELLACTVAESFDQAGELLISRGIDDLPALLHGLAETAGTRRDLGVLWNREIRHLAPERQASLRDRLHEVVSRLSAALGHSVPGVGAADAELLAWCTLAVLTSPGYHRTEILPGRLIDLLATMAVAVSAAPLNSAAEPAADLPGRGGMAPASRREALLGAATRLFGAKGYQAVTMDEIAAAVQVHSASVYRHFDTKADLLAAVIDRGAEPLQLGLSQALFSADTSQEALDAAVDAYIAFAMIHHDLLAVLTCEVLSLPPARRHAVRSAQHDYVGQWFQLLQESRPELDDTEVRFRVHAALTIVNDVSRTVRLRCMPNVQERVRLATRRALYG